MILEQLWKPLAASIWGFFPAWAVGTLWSICKHPPPDAQSMQNTSGSHIVPSPLSLIIKKASFDPAQRENCGVDISAAHSYYEEVNRTKLRLQNGITKILHPLPPSALYRALLNSIELQCSCGGGWGEENGFWPMRGPRIAILLQFCTPTTKKRGRSRGGGKGGVGWGGSKHSRNEGMWILFLFPACLLLGGGALKLPSGNSQWIAY